MAKDYSFQPCPQCRLGYFTRVGERKGGFSGGKAAAGALIAGPIGLAAGALGKKRSLIAATDVDIRLKPDLE